MPTDHLPAGLFISHPNFSYYANQEKLPEMSTEMFWWLKGHYDLSRNQEDTYLRRTVLETLTDTRVRCSYAATRIYTPPLAESIKTLTPYGSEIAEKVHQVIVQSGRSPMDYHMTMQSDTSFITALLTWRMIGLLVIMDSAIETARVQRMQHLEETNSLPPNPPISRLLNTRAPVGHDDSTEFDALGDLLASTTNKMDIYENEAKNITVHALRYGSRGLAVYVPATALGDGRGRADYRKLVKFSLLDARSIRDGSRGRSKIGLTVSSIGKQLIKDLADKGLISALPVLD